MDYSSFGELVRNGILAVGDGHRAKLDELGGDGPYFLRAGALSERGFNWTGLDSFRRERLPRIQAKLGRAGDVVITTKGNSIGRVGQVPDGSPEFVYSPHLSYWRSLDHSILAPGYLYYWSRSEYFTRQLHRLAFSTDMAPYLSLRDQMSIKIKIPPIGRQLAIAEILGALDDKIGANDRVIGVAESLMIAQAGTAPTRTTVAELAKQRKTVLSPENFEAKVAHFSLPSFDEGKMPEISPRSSIKSNKILIPGPCVLVSKLNPRIPRIWDVVSLPSEMCVASTEFVTLVPDRVPSSVLWATLSEPSVSVNLAANVAGTSGSHQRVKPAELLAVHVKDPRTLAPEVQQTIAELGVVCHRRRMESSCLRVMRDQLLPLLMSGRVRVREAEKIMEGVV